MTRLAYDTDLSDDQWALMAPYLPAVKPDGRPRTLNLRGGERDLLSASQWN